MITALPFPVDGLSNTGLECVFVYHRVFPYEKIQKTRIHMDARFYLTAFSCLTCDCGDEGIQAYRRNRPP
jgi:hypothetical protein